MHYRLYDESIVYLNRSNSKWVSIGIAPSSLEIGSTKSFTLEIRIRGDKTEKGFAPAFNVGGLAEFMQLVRQVRNIDRCRLTSLEVCLILNATSKNEIKQLTHVYSFYNFQTKSYYRGDANIDGFTIESLEYGTLLYQITKKGTTSKIIIGLTTLDGLLAAERCIMNIARRKSTEKYFSNYVEAINKKLKDRLYNLLDDSRNYLPNFAEETYSNFSALFKYDLEQACGNSEIELYPKK